MTAASTGSVRCIPCDVEVDLGPDEDEGLRIMEDFLSRHGPGKCRPERLVTLPALNATEIAVLLHGLHSLAPAEVGTRNLPSIDAPELLATARSLGTALAESLQEAERG